jgi:hypothetical protein
VIIVEGLGISKKTAGSSKIVRTLPFFGEGGRLYLHG